jgi:hypothetical protein
MHGVAMGVAENLALDMAGTLHQLFEIDFILAERRLCLAFGFGDFADKVLRVANGAHAPATAAPRCLQHDRIADLVGHSRDFVHVVGKRLCRGYDRHADLDGEIAGRHLVAQPTHRLRPGADEDDAVLGAGIGEFRAFGQQAISRMDRVRTRQLCNADHLVDRQVAFDRAKIPFQVRTTADLVGFIRLEPVQCELVLFRPDGDGFHPQFVGGAEHANGNFRTVGDKNLGNRHEEAPGLGQ